MRPLPEEELVAMFSDSRLSNDIANGLSMDEGDCDFSIVVYAACHKLLHGSRIYRQSEMLGLSA